MIAPALHFNGDCKDAIALYVKAFGIKDAHIEYYEDAPEDSGLNEKGDMAGKVMHSNLTICGSLVNMCDSETPVTITDAFRLNVFLPTAEDVRRAFDTLSEGGRVAVPFGPQFFAPSYAAVEDRFKVYWQLIEYAPE